MSNNSREHTVDRDQVRTLLRVALKIDWRGSTNPFTAMQAKRSRIPGIIVIAGMNLLISLMFGALFIRMPGLFEGLVMTAVGPLVMISLQILLEFGHIIISPTDYHVLTPHPVNSRTFYVAKLLHLLAYVTVLSLSLSLVPGIIAAIRFHSVLPFPVLIVHYWFVSIFATVFMMVVFTATMRRVDRRRVERWMSYMQMAFILMFYAGVNVLPKSLGWITANISLENLPWLRVLPSYWFGAWVGLVEQGWDMELFVFGLFGLLFLALLARIAVSYLSLSYARSLTETGSAQAGRRRTLPRWITGPWQRLARPETRALARLAWVQFKHDMQFRIQVLWIIPISVFMLIILFTSGETLPNPFGDRTDEPAGAGLGVVLVFSMMPMFIHMAITQSRTWPAAWIFYSAPINRVHMVLAAKRIAYAFFLFPGAVFLFGMFWWLFGSALHALLHTIFFAAIVHLGLTIINIIFVRLPFSTEQAHGSFTAESFLVLVTILVFLAVPMMLVWMLGYGGYPGWAVLTGIAVLLSAVIIPAQNRRIRGKIAEWELTG